MSEIIRNDESITTRVGETAVTVSPAEIKTKVVVIGDSRIVIDEKGIKVNK